MLEKSNPTITFVAGDITANYNDTLEINYYNYSFVYEMTKHNGSFIAYVTGFFNYTVSNQDAYYNTVQVLECSDNDLAEYNITNRNNSNIYFCYNSGWAKFISN